MSDIVSPLLQWLNAHPQLAGLATFVISTAESVAIIGTIVPGSIMMTAIGTLAGAGVIPLCSTIIWAILGAIVGDGISYWIGHYFKDRMNRMWPFRTHPMLLKSGEAFFNKYGAMSVFIGRFVGPVRALVPVTAGMLGMKPLTFTIANVTSAIGWAPMYMLPGILLGLASLELPRDIAIHVMLVIFLIFLFIILCLWMTYKFLQLIGTQLDQMQTSIWLWLKKRRQFKPLTVLLKHHDPQRTHGQLNLFFYFLISTFLFLCLVSYVKYVGPADIAVNDAFYHFFRGIRHATLDNIMLDISLLAQKEVIIPAILIFFAWLMIRKQWRIALHALMLGILAAGGTFVIKHILKSPRPWGIAMNPETYSMPSGHVTLATALYMGLAFLVALSVQPKRRWPIFTIGILIAFAVGVSRMYLGAHWFTDVLAAWLFSAAILIFVIISFERVNDGQINPIGILLISLLPLSLTYGFFYATHISQLRIGYSQENWPIVKISKDGWWQNKDPLPYYYVSLFGIPTQPINIEWAGKLDNIKAILLNQGWQNPPARDWVSTLHRIADIKSTQYLPMVSPQYLDKKPALIMVRQTNQTQASLVIRLWDSNRVIKENGDKLWVGAIGVIPRTYGWLYNPHQESIEIDIPTLTFPKQIGPQWEWKMDTYTSKKSIPYQIMLLKKK